MAIGASEFQLFQAIVIAAFPKIVHPASKPRRRLPNNSCHVDLLKEVNLYADRAKPRSDRCHTWST